MKRTIPKIDADLPQANKPLTPREQLFVDAYLGPAKYNGYQAALAAGIKGKPASVRSIASRMLTKVNIQKSLADRLATSALAADDALRQMAALASTGMAAYIQVSSRGKVRVDLAKAAAGGALNQIKELTELEGGRWKIKLHDRVAALQIMLKHHGLLSEKIELRNSLSPSKATEDELRMLCEKHGLPLPPGLRRKKVT